MAMRMFLLYASAMSASRAPLVMRRRSSGNQCSLPAWSIVTATRVSKTRNTNITTAGSDFTESTQARRAVSSTNAISASARARSITDHTCVENSGGRVNTRFP